MDFTENQQKAIDIRDSDVLVSAAAGSGKTRVLAERAVGRIAGEDPLDVDRMLIMTFTNAAAAEMRDRIKDLIDKRIRSLREEPGDNGAMLDILERQSILVHTADITTIHGFCKSVITDHFDEAELDPDFRVANENECKLLKQDALDECLENAYEKADPEFLDAVSCFSGAKGDAGFAGLIIPIYEFIMADPDPENFARHCCRYYEAGSFEEFSASPLLSDFLSVISQEAGRLHVQAEMALSTIDEFGVLEPYRACIEAYAGVISEIRSSLGEDDAYGRVRHTVLSADFPSFGQVKKAALDEQSSAAQADVKLCRDNMKAKIAQMTEMLAFDLNTVYEHVKIAGPQIKALIATVMAFAEIYREKKLSLNIIDFNDMEHMAVSILKNPEIADAYRERFVEIYVDEYQDTNMIQETIVSLICRHDPGNVFQVGDVKQSIYRFRQARPDIFLSKYNTYSDDSAGKRRILLNDNFRSRRETLDAVNEVFSRIMKPEVGGIDYKGAELICGARFYENELPCEQETYRTELIIGQCTELSDDEMTANIIGERILSMIKSGFTVYDKAKEQMRPASFRDFTVLVRSVRKYEPVFREVFASMDIPLSVPGREGYYGTLEVKTALAFLSAVDNPYCDIPLATLLRSPVGGFSDTDLAALSAGSSPGMCLYERVKAAAQSEDESSLKDKCAKIMEMLRRYRVMSTYTPVHGILSDFIDNLYGDYVRCMSRGDQRMANLGMLLTKAEDYGKTDFKGLYQFVRYMEQIRKYEIDDGEAGISSDNDDVVRIMTMHASKGLEFPVCFVAGIEKRRNASDESGKVIWNFNYGFGADYTDLEKRTSGITLPKIIVREENRTEAVAEELRILYVAMTRAREKLIMVGCDKKEFTGRVLDIRECSSYLQMIEAACGTEGFRNIDVSYRTEEELVYSRLAGHIEREAAADTLLSVAREPDPGKDFTPPEYLEPLAFSYPYPIRPDLAPKVSVSELKHLAMKEVADPAMIVQDGKRLFSDTDPEKYIPKFMRAEGQTARGGTFYGTAFHRIMELWEYPQDSADVTEDEVRQFADEMHRLRRMDKDEAEAVRPEDVAFFLNSPLGRRMKEAKGAGKLFREQPFMIGADEDGETILVQGIIDAFFTEEDGITVVDYKTDSVSDGDMLVNRYRTQLEYYGKALSQITGKKIKALTIYSTKLRKEIPVS